MFLRVFCISAFALTLRKSAEHRVERASRATHATDASRQTMFSSLIEPEWSPRSLWGALEGLLALLLDPPGHQLRSLGALLGALGRSWDALGTLLVRSWYALGALLGALGRSASSSINRQEARGRRFSRSELNNIEYRYII